MTESFKYSDGFSGQLAMITSISSDSMRVNFRFPNGNSGFMTSENDVALHPGEVILISGNEFRVADPSMWIEEKKIGVIRKIINK